MGHDAVINLFYKEPGRKFLVREIAKLTKVPKTTVHTALKKLLRSHMVKVSKGLYPMYSADTSSSSYKVGKKLDFLYSLYGSGIVEHIHDTLSPGCIILFGSFAKGEYDKDSDIDLFVQSSQHNLNLKTYEKRLGHKVHIYFEPNLKKLSDELLNNIINGTKLDGYIRLR